jgi:hypothetical protein
VPDTYTWGPATVSGWSPRTISPSTIFSQTHENVDDTTVEVTCTRGKVLVNLQSKPWGHWERYSYFWPEYCAAGFSPAYAGYCEVWTDDDRYGSGGPSSAVYAPWTVERGQTLKLHSRSGDWIDGDFQLRVQAPGGLMEGLSPAWCEARVIFNSYDW